jgi:hypothetical protein
LKNLVRNNPDWTVAFAKVSTREARDRRRIK